MDDLAVLNALFVNERADKAMIEQLERKNEALRIIIKSAIGRMMNAKFDINYGNPEQAERNLCDYIKLTRGELARATGTL